MPVNASKIEDVEELERLLDEWEEQQKKKEDQNKTNVENAQEEPPKFPSIKEEPKYVPRPPQPKLEEPINQTQQLSDSDRKLITLLAEKLAEKTGRSPEIIQLILEEILNEDRQTLNMLRDYLSIARLLSSSGDVSQRVGDMTNASLSNVVSTE